MWQKGKKIIKAICFSGIVVGLIYVLTLITLPKIPDFYKEEQWDVVFFGTSQCYCTFDPAVFDEYNIKSYNRGRPQQTLNYTYYYIKDALDVSDIDIVVLEMFAAHYGEGDERFTNEYIQESSLVDFRYSPIKMEMIKDCVSEDTQWSHYFPLDKYHSNWEKWDFTSLEAIRETVFNPYFVEEPYRGYSPWDGMELYYYPEPEEIFAGNREPVYDKNIHYLDLIYELCIEHDAQLMLVRGPLPCYETIIGETNTVFDWAAERDIPCVNFMQLTTEYGMNIYTDSSDGGTHLNSIGAEKVSRYLAEYIVQNYY